MSSSIWYQLYNIKNVKNTHGRLSLLGKVQTLACNYAKSSTPPWVFFTFFKIEQMDKLAQSISEINESG